MFFDGRKLVLAHRFAYELLRGPIPEGMTIDHLCRTRSCVNPEHFEVVTRGENVLRGVGPPAMNARKTHCAKGHPLVEGNLVLNRLKHGYRECLICSREYHLRHYYKTKEVIA